MSNQSQQKKPALNQDLKDILVLNLVAWLKEKKGKTIFISRNSPRESSKQ